MKKPFFACFAAALLTLLLPATASAAIFTFACDPVFTEQIDGFETAVVSFTTDIPALTNWGKPLLFGPGSILDAHTDHERISKKELLEGIDLYVRLVKILLSK